jgi:hypothetical protein
MFVCITESDRDGKIGVCEIYEVHLVVRNSFAKMKHFVIERRA